MKTLFVFMDESGNFDFSAKGSNHLVLSAVYTDDPCTSARAMQELKYDLFAQGSSDLEFHATDNTYATRQAVYRTIQGLAGKIQVHTIWLDKHYAHPKLQNDVAMFSMFGTAMGRWIMSVPGNDYDQVVLVFDSVLTGKNRGAFTAKVVPELKKLGVSYRLLFHPVKSDLNGQIADYYSWAMFRKLESNDPRPCEQLAGPHWDDFNLFNQGTTLYY